MKWFAQYDGTAWRFNRMKWFAQYDGTAFATVPSEWGSGRVTRYGKGCYRASVVKGNEVADIHTDTLADALRFVASPFRYIASGDYWNGTEIMRGSR